MTQQQVIAEILSAAPKLTPNWTKVGFLFDDAGIIVTNDLMFLSFRGNPDLCIRRLIGNLTEIPLVRIAALRILDNRGMTVG